VVKTENKNCLDRFKKENNCIKHFDADLFRFLKKHKNQATLFSKSKRSTAFFTNDSGLYFTQSDLQRKRRGEKIVRIISRLDSLNHKALRRYQIQVQGQKLSFFQARLQEKYANFREQALELAHSQASKISVVKMWNISIVASIIFGMFSMTMIYRYLGQTVSAKIAENKTALEYNIESKKESKRKDVDKKEIEENISQISDDTSGIDINTINEILSKESEQNNLEDEIRGMVRGYPIEEMVPEIAKRDRVVAAFIVGIARKESGWGVHVPVLNGQDCYNYWGYRGIRDRMGTGGHTCFNDPKDAVDTVAKRIEFLVSNKKLNTPQKMVIWKCGSNCSVTGGQAAANKWISDVGIYFDKLNSNNNDSK
jgi:hypothetical protein